MRKRSKKRTPQDTKPWVGVKTTNLDVFTLPGKKTSRWVAGSRRDWDTRVLHACAKQEISDVMIKSLIESLGASRAYYTQMLVQKLSASFQGKDRTASLTKYKNFCLLSGRGRTYSRSLYMARHNMRKLMGLGVISGLNK